jgi:hypothetical protein
MYAVGMQTGHSTRWEPALPPAGRKVLDLLHKKIHNVNFFVQKKKTYHAAAGENSFRVWHKAGTSHTT